jgi:catechol 2,3-dioxygenase-like lactoylglutathione lyase family enzyme
MSATFEKIIPSLPVSSIPESIEFYTQKLGFRVAGRDRDDHTWLQLVGAEDVDKADAAVNVYLRRRGFPDLPDDAAFGKVYIRLAGTESDELEKFLESVRGKGVKVRNEITTKPWGLKDFTIADLDGVSYEWRFHSKARVSSIVWKVANGKT